MRYLIGLFMIPVLIVTAVLNAEERGEPFQLELKEMKVGTAGGVLSKIKGWYGASDRTVFKAGYVDLNGDGVKEVIVSMQPPSCSEKKVRKCKMFVMYQRQNGNWDSLTTSPRSEKVFLMPSATKGWRDLKFDDILYVFDNYSLPAYHESDTPGTPVNANSTLGTQTISHFGLSMQIGSDWKARGYQNVHKMNQIGYANYEGVLPEASKKAYLSIEVTPKKEVEDVFRDHSSDSVKKMVIGKGQIQGHPVTVYYLNINHGQAGSVYLAFEDEVYFSDPDDPDGNFFPMYLYVSVSGELLYGVKREALQSILKHDIAPLLNTIRVTEENTFATDTTSGHTPLVLRPPMQEEEVQPVYSRETGVQKNASSFHSDQIVWHNILVENKDGEWRKMSQSDERHLVLQSSMANPKEIMVFIPNIAITDAKQTEVILDRSFRVLRSSPHFKSLKKQTESTKTVFAQNISEMFVGNYKNKMKVFIIYPYFNGALHMIMLFTTDQESEDLSPGMQHLLKGLSHDEEVLENTDPFKKLTFSVNIDYTAQALKKLKETGEMVEVDAIIDQYGKTYMEKEAVAYETKVVSPGESITFYGVSLSDENYHFQKEKRYVVTVMVLSARKAASDNLLDCEDVSGNIDYSMSSLQNKVLKFKCKLINEEGKR